MGLFWVHLFPMLGGGPLTHLRRRVVLKSVLAAALLIVLASCSLVLGGRSAGGAAAVGELGYAACIATRVSPEAWIRQPTGSAPGFGPGPMWTAPAILEQGMMIKPGARVTTGPRGRVLLVFADGSTTTIEPGSDLVIGPRILQSASVAGSIVESGDGQLLRLAPPQIRLIIGRIWLEIARCIDSGPSFEVETPFSTVSVRGTAFGVEVDEEETTYVYVESGQVVVESESGSDSIMSIPMAAGLLCETSETSCARNDRGHGQRPSADIDSSSISTVTTRGSGSGAKASANCRRIAISTGSNRPRP